MSEPRDAIGAPEGAAGEGLESRVRVTRDPAGGASAFVLDAEFMAPPGVTALLGPNGAGKSTVVAALAGLVPLASGRVVVDGRVWEDASSAVRLSPRERELGIAFQSPLLFPSRTVIENVAYGPRSRGVAAADARRTAAAWLERLEAGHLSSRRPADLSGGEAQRVALARALAAEPRVLLLDEPLSAQDVRTRGALRRELAAVLTEFGGVALVVTHDPIDALTLARRVVVLEDGRVVQTGDAESLRRRPATPWVAALAGVNLLRGRLAAVGGETRLVCGELSLAILAGERGVGEEVAAVVPPRAITLSLAPPRSSARNVVAGRVAAIDRGADRVRVTLDTVPHLTAEITRESLADLALTPGTPVYAAIKVTELELLSG